MRMNHSNDMTIWLIVVGILVVIGFIIFLLRNRSMDEANERYRDAVGAANRAKNKTARRKTWTESCRCARNTVIW